MNFAKIPATQGLLQEAQVKMEYVPWARASIFQFRYEPEAKVQGCGVLGADGIKKECGFYAAVRGATEESPGKGSRERGINGGDPLAGRNPFMPRKPLTPWTVPTLLAAAGG